MHGKDENKGRFLWRSDGLCMLLILAAVLAAYSNALDVPFYFDDEQYVRDNPKIRDLSGLVVPTETRHLTYLTFALNYAACGLSTTCFHVTNVLIHAATSWLVFLFVSLTMRTPAMAGVAGSNALALLAALVFALHPVATQAVTYLTQRFASQATMFYLLTMVLYVKARSVGAGAAGGAGSPLLRSPLYWAAVVSALLAALSKEIAFTLPFMLLLYEATFFTALRDLKGRLPALLPFLAAVSVIPLLVLGGEGVASAQVYDLKNIPPDTYLITQLRVIVTYVRLLFYPAGLRLQYEYPRFDSFFDVEVIFSFLFLASIVVFAVYLMRRASSPTVSRLVPFGIFWFFLALSVESSFIPIEDVIFEHRLYLPLTGAALAFASAVWWGHGRVFGSEGRGAAFLLIILVAVPLGAATYQRNGVWADELVFWEGEAALSPGAARVRNNLGLAYYKRGRTGDAVAEYKLAAELGKFGRVAAVSNFNLGLAYVSIGRLDDAADAYERAVMMDPDYVAALTGLGGILVQKGVYGEGLKRLDRALELSPGHADALSYRAEAYIALGRMDEGMEALAAAEAESSGDGRARYNLGVVYMRLAVASEAVRSFEEAIALDPDLAEAHSNLGIVYARTGRVEEAARVLRRAVELRPGLVEARNNLANVYVMLGRVEEAIKEYELVVSLDGEHVGAYFNLGLMYGRTGRVAEAISSFERVLELNPGDEEARRLLDSL